MRIFNIAHLTAQKLRIPESKLSIKAKFSILLSNQVTAQLVHWNTMQILVQFQHLQWLAVISDPCHHFQG